MDRPIWIKTPEGDRFLLLEAHFTQPDYADGIEGYDCFVVNLTKTAVRALLARMDKVAALHAEDSMIESVDYYDCTGEWWPREFDVEDDEQLVVHWDGRSDFDSRTEVDRLTVTPDSLWWHALTKHTEMLVETDQIDRATLETLLEEADEEDASNR